MGEQLSYNREENLSLKEYQEEQEKKNELDRKKEALKCLWGKIPPKLKRSSRFSYVEDCKWAVMFAPIKEKSNIRDFRNSENLDVEISNSGRIRIKTDKNNKFEELSYNPKLLLLSVLAETDNGEVGDRNYTILPYVHMNKGKIDSQSVLILNSEQRKIIREKLLNFVGKQL